MTALATIPAGGVPAGVSTAAEELIRDSISANTRRAYGGALKRLDAWLAGRPLDDAALAAYLGELNEAERSPATAGMVVAAVRFRLSLAGEPLPKRALGPVSERALSGFARGGRAGRGRGQVAAVRWEQADAAAAVAGNGGSSVRGLRDAAILSVASDAMLRVSEAAALDVADVAGEADGTGRITVRQSKTDQKGEGAVLFLGEPTMRRVQAWLAAAGSPTSGPLFRQVRRGGSVTTGRLSDRAIRRVIAERARAAGIEGRVSGHSLRVGSAQSLAAAGASLVEMQTAGRWGSPAMPARYTRSESAARGAVARLRYAD